MLLAMAPMLLGRAAVPGAAVGRSANLCRITEPGVSHMLGPG